MWSESSPIGLGNPAIKLAVPVYRHTGVYIKNYTGIHARMFSFKLFIKFFSL